MRVAIAVKARFIAPFTVGSGAMGDVLTNKPTFKDGRQRPVIPGSAFKGRLRHTCERLLRSLLNDDAAACGAPVPERACPLDPDRLGQYCPVCRLFGSPRRPSSLMFTDLRWENTVLPAPTAIRTGVSINRKRRVAESGRLYDMELVHPLDIFYQGEIVGQLADADAHSLIALLWGGLQAVNALGGNRSGGLGRCALEPEVKVDRRVVDADWLREGLEEGLQQWRY
ncbi:MAG: hypothetical protein GY803_14765 [Chloroflexi bacterium]|nr:hypothetical protein [Chloroflexota bacterium]